MRSLLKEWKNGRYQPKWTVRIRWYEGGIDGQDVRLNMEDCERETNLFPTSKEEADKIWFLFKQGAPPESAQIPLIAILLKLLVVENGRCRTRKPNEPFSPA